MTAQSVLIWGAFSLYTAATFAAFGYLFTKDHRASRAMLILLGIGLLLHVGGFAAHVAAFWAYPEHPALVRALRWGLRSTAMGPRNLKSSEALVGPPRNLRCCHQTGG